MLIKNVKTGALCGSIYGLCFLVFEDATAYFVNQMDFTFRQLYFSLAVYTLSFAFLGLCLGILLSIVQRKPDRADRPGAGRICLWLSALAVILFAYRDLPVRLFHPLGMLHIPVALGWALLIVIVYGFVWTALRRWRRSNAAAINVQDMAASALITSFLILNVKIDYDPIVADQLSILDPWWRILAGIFSLGIFFLIMVAAPKLQENDRREHPHRFRYGILLTGLAMMVGSLVLGRLAGSHQSEKIISAEKLRAEPDRANVLLIVIDTLRPDHTSLYGYHRETTPYLSEYSSRGVVFRNAYALSSWTKPSVASMLTSLPPGIHAVEKFFDALPAESVTIPEVLSDYNYYSKCITSNGLIIPEYHFDQGYDEFLYLPGHGFKQLLQPAVIVRSPSGALMESAYRMGFVDGNALYGDAASMNKAALPWLQAHKQVRFFLYLHYMDPHIPYYPVRPQFSAGEKPPKGLTVFFRELRKQKHELREDNPYVQIMQNRYNDEICEVDRKLKNLFKTLEKTKLWDNTLVIITADHGEEFADHGKWEHGHTLYQELIHVPLILFFPDKTGAGKTIETRVDLLDIAPTLYDYLGIPAPNPLNGVSMMPLIEGDEELYRRAKVSHFSEVIPTRLNWDISKTYALIKGDYKLIEDVYQDAALPHRISLFNLRTDPTEQSSLTASLPDLTVELTAEMIAFQNYCQSIRIQAEEVPEIQVSKEHLERLRALGYVK